MLVLGIVFYQFIGALAYGMGSMSKQFKDRVGRLGRDLT